MTRRRKLRIGVVCVALATWPVAAMGATSPSALAGPDHGQPPLGPGVGQPCNDPLKLAIDPSGAAIMCTRYGQWVQSVMPSTVRSLGAPCSPNDPVAKTPDDHLIGCQSGLWTLYHP